MYGKPLARIYFSDFGNGQRLVLLAILWRFPFRQSLGSFSALVFHPNISLIIISQIEQSLLQTASLCYHYASTS
jgi:hypothetical protein